MAKKKIDIEDKPEEVEVSAIPPAEESVAEEVSTSEEPTTEEKQSEAELEQPSEESEVAPEAQQPQAEVAPPNAKRRMPKLRSPKLPKSLHRNQLIVIIVLLIAIAGGLYLLLTPSNPLPKVDTNLAKFKVYYPKSNASGFTYAAGSANFTAGQLTYSLEPKNTPPGTGGPIIRINEVAIKGTGPNLSDLTNFTVMKVPAGNAAIGSNGSILNGVIETKKTLIILNGLDGATKDQLLDVMKSM